MHLWCCLFPSNLCSHFINEMEHGTYRLNDFQMSISWAVYHVKNIVNVLLQMLLHHVPSCEENLVLVKCLGLVLVSSSTSLTFVELSGLLLLKAIRGLCGRRHMLWGTTASILIFKASKLDELNCQCRGRSSYVLQWQVFLLTISKYALTTFLTCWMRWGKRGTTDGGMNGFESALVSSSNFMALQRV